MKKYDAVKIKKLEENHFRHNLQLARIGFVMSLKNGLANVLFMNDYKHGDYCVYPVEVTQLSLVKFEMNASFIEYFDKLSLQINEKTKDYLFPLKFKEYDEVELVCDKPKYAKYGMGKGTRGFVIIDYAIDNHILVDFGDNMKIRNVNDDGILSVSMKDLKKVEE